MLRLPRKTKKVLLALTSGKKKFKLWRKGEFRRYLKYSHWARRQSHEDLQEISDWLVSRWD